MTDDCIFCDIIDGELPSHKVLETDEVVAFLDVNPVSKGHTLVVPKEHVEDIHGTRDMEFMWDALVEVADAVEEAFDPDGIQVSQNNGEKAGQEVFHMHFHVTPVYTGEEIEVHTERSELENGEEIAEEIEEHL
jgi:histidine triad (HIT) family protein